VNPDVAVSVDVNLRLSLIVRLIVLVVDVDAMVDASTLRCTRFECVRGPY
jgi:hypothetical protein